MDEDKETSPEEQQIPSEPLPEIRDAVVPKEIEKEPQQVAQPTQAYVPKTSAAVAEAKESRWQKFKGFLVECSRVLRVTKKPNREEFKTIVKISGIGMAVIGFLGFLVTFAKELIF